MASRRARGASLIVLALGVALVDVGGVVAAEQDLALATTPLGSDRSLLPERFPAADWLPIEGPLLSGQLVVTVDVDGQSVRAIVDTGSQVSVISEPLALELGLVTVSHDASVLDSHGERVDGKRVRASLLSVGRRTFADVTLLVFGEQPFRLLLGVDVLRALDLVIAADDGLLGVFDAGSAPIDDASTVLALDTMRTLLTVPASASGRRGRASVSLLVDTGASITAVPARHGMSAGLPADLSFASTTIGMGGTHENRGRFILDPLTLGRDGFAVPRVYALAGVIGGGEAFGLLGNDVLFRYRTTISFSRRTLALAPLPRRPAERTTGPSGIRCDTHCVEVALVRRVPTGAAKESTRSDRCLATRVSRAYAGRALELAVVGHARDGAPLPGGIRVLTTVGPAGVDECFALPLGMAKVWPDDVTLSLQRVRSEHVRWTCDPLETHCASFMGPLPQKRG